MTFKCDLMRSNNNNKNYIKLYIKFPKKTKNLV